MDKLLASHEVEYIRNRTDPKEADLERIMRDIDNYLVELPEGQIRSPFDNRSNEGFLIEPDKIDSYSFELPNEAGPEGQSVIWHFKP